MIPFLLRFHLLQNAFRKKKLILGEPKLQWNKLVTCMWKRPGINSTETVQNLHPLQNINFLQKRTPPGHRIVRCPERVLLPGTDKKTQQKIIIIIKKTLPGEKKKHNNNQKEPCYISSVINHMDNRIKFLKSLSLARHRTWKNKVMN